MSLLKDNVVKMDWETDDCLFTKGGKFGKTFIFASKEYSTPKGNITVFFTCDTAFLWASDPNTEDEDLWNAKELKSVLKKNISEAFPVNFREYVPLIEYGATEVLEEVVDKYGLGKHVEDIKKRLEDVSGYAEEKTAQL